MRLTRYAALISIAFLQCCSKPDQQPQPPNPPPVVPLGYTPVPVTAPVNSSVLLYAVDNNQNTYPVYAATDRMQYNTTQYTYVPDVLGFASSSNSFDLYNSTVTLWPSYTADYNGYTTNKTFTVTPSLKNYVDVKITAPFFAGFVYNYSTDSSLSLPNEGQITFAKQSVLTDPPNSHFGVYTKYFSPEAKDFIISIPSAVADEGGKRWFINSYGAYLIQLRNTIGFNIYGNAMDSTGVVLKMKIAEQRRTGAPDSLPAWFIPFNSNATWQKRGYAVKKGDYYQKAINSPGYWNFAEQNNAVYIAVHLQTTDSLPLTNTRFRIKAGVTEIADSRSDADGNALVFVPTNKPLVMELINDQGIAPPEVSLDLGTITTPKEIIFQVPDRIDIIKVFAKVYNCDGSLFGNGKAVFAMRNSKDAITTPVKNGSFSLAHWTRVSQRFGTVKIYDSNNSLVLNYPYGIGSSQSLPFNERVQYDLPNFYTCNNPNQLYCNYRVDDVQYNLSGDTANTSSAFKATPYLSSSSFTLLTQKDGKGIEFIFLHAAQTNFTLTSAFKLNGTSYIFNSSDVAITRFDESATGIIEGWFYITYKDTGGILHKISGNFRIKKQP